MTAEVAKRLQVLQAMQSHQRVNRLDTYFPDSGEFRRELYKPHLEFFKASATHRELCFLAGNRTGKTDSGAYLTTLSLTGLYPDWWEGRRWNRPIKSWAAGENSKVVRETLQEKLLGKFGEYGTGFIPKDALVKITAKQGIAETVDTVYVRHKAGGVSSLVFKTYQEGVTTFAGGSIDLFWGDEEIPESIYDEAQVRLMVSEGLSILTYTPLLGLSEITLRFLPGGVIPQEELAHRASEASK